MTDKIKVESKAIGKISIFRKILSRLPYFCQYCGKYYVPCHNTETNSFMPLPQNGRCCPDGHEGYTDEFLGFSINRKYFDKIKHQ